MPVHLANGRAGMPVTRRSLAKVMTQANEHDHTGDHVRRGPGLSAQDLGQPARAPAPRRASGARVARAVRAVRHPAGRPRDAGATRRDDPGRAGRARKGAAALHDEGHSRPRAAQPGDAGAARDRQASGGAHGDRRGQGPRAPVAQAQGSLAGQAAAGADPGGTGEAAGGGADSGAAQPVLAGPAPGGPVPADAVPVDAVLAGLVPAEPVRADTVLADTGRRTFGSLHSRNYRLFATGQVIWNTGSWMQRVAQDWLVLDLTRGSGSALGITTGLQFLPLLLFSLWGGMLADRYSKRRILMVTQAAAGGLAVVLGLLALTHAVAIWHVYALAFALRLVTAVGNPTRQGLASRLAGGPGVPN